MKRHNFLAIVIAFATSIPSISSAYNLLPDQNFDQSAGTSVSAISGYTVGEIGGSEPLVVGENLTYPYLSEGSGNAVQMLAEDKSFTISFDPPNLAENPIEYNNTWFSAIIRVNANALLGTDGESIISLVQNGVSIAGFALRDNGAGKFQVGATRSGVATQWNTNNISYGETVFLVGVYSWESPFGRPGGLHGYAYDHNSADIFATNNGPDGPGTDEFWTYSYSDSLQPNGILFNSSLTADIVVDAVRVGTTGSDVAPVPEPSVTMLLGVVLGALALSKLRFLGRTNCCSRFLRAQ